MAKPTCVKISRPKICSSDHGYDRVYIHNQAPNGSDGMISMLINDHNTVRWAIRVLARALQTNLQVYQFSVWPQPDGQWTLGVASEPDFDKAAVYTGILMAERRRHNQRRARRRNRKHKLQTQGN
jgi:hypothetical protein